MGNDFYNTSELVGACIYEGEPCYCLLFPWKQKNSARDPDPVWGLQIQIIDKYKSQPYLMPKELVITNENDLAVLLQDLQVSWLSGALKKTIRKEYFPGSYLSTVGALKAKVVRAFTRNSG